MTNVKTIIGRIPVYRGQWSSDASVYKHNMFIHNGSEWISLIDDNTDEPMEGSNTWDLITAGGGGGGGGRASQVVLDNDVSVSGGPLAEHLTSWVNESGWGTISGGNAVIPKGTNVQTMLDKLFFYDNVGSLSNPIYSWNPVQKSPNASINSSDLIEVNSTVTISYSPNNDDVTLEKDATATVTSSYGYFIDNSTEHHNGSYVQTKIGTFSGNSTASGKWNGTSESTGANVSVSAGINTLSVSQSGKKCKVDEFDASVIWPSTRLNTKMNTGSKTIGAQSYGEITLTATTKNATVTGVYPIYTNGKSAAIDTSPLPESVDNSAGIDYKLPLVDDSDEFGVLFPAQSVKENCIAIHSSKIIEYAFGFDSLKGDYSVSIQFTKDANASTRVSGGTNEQYYIWRYGIRGTDGPARMKIKIKNNNA